MITICDLHAPRLKRRISSIPYGSAPKEIISEVRGIAREQNERYPTDITASVSHSIDNALRVLIINGIFMNLNFRSTAARLGSCALLATLAGLPLCVSAAADDSRSDPAFYIGAGIGYDRLDGEDFTGNGDDIDDKRVTYKGYAGFRLNDIFALEGQYVDFGTAEDGGNRVEADGFTAGVVVDIPIFEYVHPYAKAGALFWDAEGEFADIKSSDDDTDFTYGFGLRFAVNDYLDLRAEYERFKLNDTDVDNVWAMIQYNF